MIIFELESLQSSEIPRGENGSPFQYTFLGNLMGRGARQVIVHEVTKNWTWLSTWSSKRMFIWNKDD